ncbi:MAG: HlyD family secretion protein [Hyphomicrobiaceae bacterium]
MQKATPDERKSEPAPPNSPGGVVGLLRGIGFAPRGRLLPTLLIALAGPLAAATLGAYIYLAGGRYVSTDNAYVKADKIAISPEISGRVARVGVVMDQKVEKGALLFEIDAAPYRIALDKAEAQLASATRNVEALRALYKQKTARLKLAEGDEAFNLQMHDRQQQLSSKGVVSQSGMDTAEKNLRNARDQIGIIKQEIAEALAKLGGAPDAATPDHPAVREAKALRDQAALDLERTRIRAPASGVVTNFELQPGEHVTAGKVVFSLVSDEQVWIQANFKETDLTNVKVGQGATVHVDTYPDHDLDAKVASISFATGAEFAVLPPQNATGNWVKVVQRLPVRLRLARSESKPSLRAGMSVVVSIDTGHRRQLPRWLQTVLGTTAPADHTRQAARHR